MPGIWDSQKKDNVNDNTNERQEYAAQSKRLQQAFRTVTPTPQLADNIRQLLVLTDASAARPARRFGRWLTAAVIILGAGIALFYLGPAPDATAAQRNLLHIHQSNLAPDGAAYRESDPQRVAARIRQQLGCCPVAPLRDSHSAGRNTCTCVNCTCDPSVCSYLVDTDRGPISGSVVPDRPAALGMRTAASGLWQGAVDGNNLVAQRVQDYTYCAVGAVSNDALTQLLFYILPTGPS